MDDKMNDKAMNDMFMDWCQSWVDDPGSDDDPDLDEEDLDLEYENIQDEWYPHYEPDEDDDPDLGDGEDQDLYDDEVYEAAKEEYVSRYSSEAGAIKNFEDWLLWNHTRRS